MSATNASLTEVKRKIALAIRNNYLNSNLPLIEFANANGVHSISTLVDIANINVSDHKGHWMGIPIETYLSLADNLNIVVELNVNITRG